MHAEFLKSNLLGNPHSANPSSTFSAKIEAETRKAVLEFFGADPEEYDVVFTANATAGLKLVGESLSQLDGGFKYVVSRDSHTSLTGVRTFSREFLCMESEEHIERWLKEGERKAIREKQLMSPAGCSSDCGERQELSGTTSRGDIESEDSGTQTYTLFAYPLQSNFDGKRHSTSYPRRVRDSLPKTLTLIDAASYAMTSPLNISAVAPDFVVTSFYKIFGYPDLGCLVLRRDVAPLLRKRTYFGGGTIEAVLVHEPVHDLKQGEGIEPHVYLEDGTIAFHSIAALGEAIRVQKRLYGDMSNVARHSTALAAYAREKMMDLRYPDGSPLINMYSEIPNTQTQGSILTFNALEPRRSVAEPETPTSATSDSTFSYSHLSEKVEASTRNVPPPSTLPLQMPIPFTRVEKSLAARHIHVRAGRHCNIGGLHRKLGLDYALLRRAYDEGLRCNGKNDIEIYEGQAMGAVRVSFGGCSSIGDVEALIKGLREEFL